MESDGILEMYQQSIQMYNVWYNPFIRDGDSSTYATVNKADPTVQRYSNEKKNVSTM